MTLYGETRNDLGEARAMTPPWLRSWGIASSTKFTIIETIHLEVEYLSVVCWCSSGGGTPVPIPNTEVKPASTDGTPFGGE